MTQPSIKALSERIATTLPGDRKRRTSVLQDLKSLRQRLSPQAPRDRLDRLDAAVLLMEFMATVQASVTSDALRVVARLVATLDMQGELEPTADPVPESESISGMRSGDLQISYSVLLGQVLVEADVVTIDDVGQALRMQLSTGRPIGACLMELGKASLGQITNALRLQDELRGAASGDSAVSHAPPTVETPGNRPHAPISVEVLPEHSGPQDPLPASGHEPLSLRGNSRDYMHSALDFLLGEILVRQGSITRIHLKRALSTQHASGCFLGETLVEIGAATWDQVKTGLRLQKELR